MDDVDLRRALVQRLDVARVRDLDDAAVFAALHGSSFRWFAISYLSSAVRGTKLPSWGNKNC